MSTPSQPLLPLDWELTHPGLPHPSLNILPPELREAIWKYTFPPPRTLQVEAHACHIADRKAKQSGLRPNLLCVDPQKRHRSYVFIVTDLTPGNQREWKATNPGDAPPPIPPVALLVCRESRAIAMKKYEIGFRPRTLKIARNAEKLEARQEANVSVLTWFDFESDTIVMDRVFQFFRIGVCVDIRTHAVRLSTCDLGELKKIKNLGLRCPLDLIRRPFLHVSAGFPNYHSSYLMNFKSLATLKLFNLTYFERGGWRSLEEDQNWPPLPVEQDGTLRDLANEVMKHLALYKEYSPLSWSADIPLVSVEWGSKECFYEYQDWTREGVLFIEGRRSYGDRYGNPQVLR